MARTLDLRNWIFSSSTCQLRYVHSTPKAIMTAVFHGAMSSWWLTRKSADDVYSDGTQHRKPQQM